MLDCKAFLAQPFIKNDSGPINAFGPTIGAVSQNALTSTNRDVIPFVARVF